MDISASASNTRSSLGGLSMALENQKLAPQLISKTLDKLNTSMTGMTPTVNPTYDTQKAVLSAAYAEKGLGTRLDVSV